MPTQISGDTGVSAVQPGVVAQGDLTTNVVGNGPAFRAKLNASQAIVDATWSAITTWSDVLDTNSAMGATNFVPQVAGWYQINLSVELGGVGIITAGAAIHVNGLQNGVTFLYLPSNNQTVVSVSDLVYLNGSTDYVSFHAFADVASTPVVGVISKCSGVLVRAA